MIPEDIMAKAKSIWELTQYDQIFDEDPVAVIATAIQAERTRCAALANHEVVEFRKHGQAQAAFGAVCVKRAIVGSPC
jgi:hypothetical protein